MADRIATQKTVVSTPIGPVGLTLRAGRVVDVSFHAGSSPRNPRKDAVMREAYRLLRRYFQNPRSRLNLPLAPAGTPFQQRVWRALRRIPPGQVRSYGQLARSLGTSARAIGGACRANPIPLFIPCHRVVASGGEGGFMGKTAGRAMAVKRWLLRHERGG
jgi:methylated-DNA-[protein]-cysteine S-methyltransferase